MCSICGDASRDAGLLMVVSREGDLDAIEKSGLYRGLYFVLGGNIPILEKTPEQKIRINELIQRIEEDGKEDKLKEIILSLSATPEGEHTSDYIKATIRGLLESFTLKISSLGRGLSTGSELEYADPDTLRYALSNRK